MADTVSCRHRLVFRFITASKKENALIPPWGTRTEDTFCGTTLFAEKRPPHSGANTPAAFNAGNTSADTPVSPFPVPSAAHLLLRFSLRSQLPELSVDALTALLPRLWFWCYRLPSLNTRSVLLSSAFFFLWRIILRLRGRCGKMRKNKWKGCYGWITE